MSDQLEPMSADAGEALRLFLSSMDTIKADTGSRISLSLTGDAPAIRYALLGHVPLGPGAGSSRFQVECWGRGGGVVDDGTASRLARAVIAAVPHLFGVWAGANVAGAAVSNAYTSADVTTGRPRVIVEVVFNHTPAS